MPRRHNPRRGGRSRGSPPKPAAGVELEKFTSSDLRTWKRQSENLEKYHVQLYYHLEGLRALHHDELCEALCTPGPVELELVDSVRIVDYKYNRL